MLVQQIRALLATMPETESGVTLKEQCLEAIALADPDSSTSTELEAAVDSLESVINKVFLQNDRANSA
jgi:hypothetical protein